MALLAFTIRFALSTKCVSWRSFQVQVYVAFSQICWVSRRPFRPEIAKCFRCFSVKLHWVSRWPFRVENCIWSYKGLSCVRLSISASFRVVIMFQEFLQVSFHSKPHFTKLHIIPYHSTRIVEALFDLVHISSIPTNPTWTLQESRSFIWRPWCIDLSLALLQKDLTSLPCVVLYLDLLMQQAPQQPLSMVWEQCLDTDGRAGRQELLRSSSCLNVENVE